MMLQIKKWAAFELFNMLKMHHCGMASQLKEFGMHHCGITVRQREKERTSGLPRSWQHSGPCGSKEMKLFFVDRNDQHGWWPIEQRRKQYCGPGTVVLLGHEEVDLL